MELNNPTPTKDADGGCRGHVIHGSGDFAYIDAPESILEELGLDHIDVDGRLFKVTKKDEYGGMYAPCSEVLEVDPNTKNPACKSEFTYIVPTRFLEFT
jgi:hypothetical protein